LYLERAAVSATEPRALREEEGDSQIPDDEQEPSTYQAGSRYRASEVPSQYSTDHYLELLDTASYENVDPSPDQHHQQFNDDYDDNDNENGAADDDAAGDDYDHYDQLESPYDHPDPAVVQQEMPPEQSIYDRLTR